MEPGMDVGKVVEKGKSVTRACPDCGKVITVVRGEIKNGEWYCWACRKGWIYANGLVWGFWDKNRFTPIRIGCLEINDERGER